MGEEATTVRDVPLRDVRLEIFARVGIQVDAKRSRLRRRRLRARGAGRLARPHARPADGPRRASRGGRFFRRVDAEQTQRAAGPPQSRRRPSGTAKGARRSEALDSAEGAPGFAAIRGARTGWRSQSALRDDRFASARAPVAWNLVPDDPRREGRTACHRRWIRPRFPGATRRCTTCSRSFRPRGLPRRRREGSASSSELRERPSGSGTTTTSTRTRSRRRFGASSTPCADDARVIHRGDESQTTIQRVETANAINYAIIATTSPRVQKLPLFHALQIVIQHVGERDLGTLKVPEKPPS